MYKLVAFDWNGTILADTRICYKITREGFKIHMGKEISFNRFVETFDVPISKLYLANGISQEDLDKNRDVWTEYFHTNYEVCALRARTRSGVREILELLKKSNIKAAIFSNHISDKIDLQIKRLGLDGYFDAVMANDSIYSAVKARTKKEKLISYIKENGFSSEEVLLVGDTREEIEIGREIKATTVGLTGGNQSNRVVKAAAPDYLIHNLRDLKEIIWQS